MTAPYLLKEHAIPLRAKSPLRGNMRLALAAGESNRWEPSTFKSI